MSCPQGQGTSLHYYAIFIQCQNKLTIPELQHKRLLCPAGLGVARLPVTTLVAVMVLNVCDKSAFPPYRIS